MLDFLIPVAALGTLIIGAVSAWNALSHARSARFLDRTKSLLELQEILESRGPLTGDDASARSPTAHSELLSRFELEARANAVLYLKSSARLTRPGSVVTGALLTVYGIFVAAIAFAQLGAIKPQSAAAQIGIWIACGVFCVIGIAISGFGMRHFARRLESRDIRSLIGRKDDLTAEGLADMTRLNAILQGFSRWLRGLFRGRRPAV